MAGFDSSFELWVAGCEWGCGMGEFEQQVLSELSVLKAQMQQLLGIGQPGRLQALEGRVEEHERDVQRWKGVVSAWGGVLTLAHLAVAWFVERR
ncbi:hypothetical protein ACFQBQ_11380 [Granulicella cerasi]|uniref:Uncharacterized protein n=1 Tax=Granulicella cerasi TaxID=741063 RepID=A0ABW1Z9T6_9BACT|nr:hypothetical protein [Granulicella cerasi]